MKQAIIPAPDFSEIGTESLDFSSGFAIDASPELETVAGMLTRGLQFFSVKYGSENGCKLVLVKDAALAPSEMQVKISTAGVILCGGDENGLCRAVGTLLQLIAVAVERGGRKRLLPIGKWGGKSLFRRRGVLLDCARQFVSVKAIKSLLELMAQLGLNILHWHLCDSEGWRYESQVLPGVERDAVENDGFYSRADIAEIRALAASIGIEIIPELELPAHAARLLKHYPEYSCTPDNPGEEICIGNPSSLELGKKLLKELMELFPESRWIHLGGDEAVGDNWRRCPRCQQAADACGGDMREAEFKFMCQLSDFVQAEGRTPIIWGAGTGKHFPPGCVIQLWLSQNEGELAGKHGNHTTFSYHPFLYLDYPEKAAVPDQDWMVPASERSVLHANPWCCGDADGKVDGVECCVWTEYIPEWRLPVMLLPRLLAVAEVASRRYEDRNWYDYLERREHLEATGYLNYLRSLF